MTRALGLALVAASLTLAACAQTPESKLKADLDSMQRESSAGRLAARGEASASVGDLTRAEQYFVSAMKAGGAPKPLTQRLLAVCAADARYPVALMYAEDYLRKHPGDVDVRYAAAAIYAATGDHERARSGLEVVVKTRPDLADAHYALASIITKDGDDPVRADLHYREYLRLDPKGAFAESARASLLKSVP